MTEEESYDEWYARVFPDLAANRRAFNDSMIRVHRIWEMLAFVWETRNTDWGWGIYYAIEKRYGSVPAPDEITPLLIRDGLLTLFDDVPWKTWVEKKYVEHQARISA